MQLTLREAAGYLGVTEAVLRRWITDRDLPVHHADERVYLNAVELWEWAVEHGVPASRRLLEHARRAPDPVPPMSELLRAGGIFHDVDAPDKLGVLREFVARLPLPPEQNRDALLERARGARSHGLHRHRRRDRHPPRAQSDRAACRAAVRHALPVASRRWTSTRWTGKPVHALFMVVSPTVPVHLRILGQLGFLLRDDELRRLLRDRGPADAIIGRVAMVEATKTTGSFARP